MPFDPNTFMTQTIDTPLSTDHELVPVGDHQAMIDDFEAEKAFRTFDSEKGGEQRTFTVFSPPFSILTPEVLAKMERDKVVVYHKGIFIDTDPAGQLDTGKGKNVDLGKLKEAVGQNVAGWNFSMLRGSGPLMVRVEHEVEKNKDSGLPTGRKFARVTRVAKIA